MSGTVAAAMTPRNRVTPAIDAMRSIHWSQVRITATLGICLTLATLAVYIVPIAQIAATNPLWAVITEIAVGDQIKAFCLLIAIALANHAADRGYSSRKAYLLAAVAGCLIGVVASEAFGWTWRSAFETGTPPATRPWLQGTANLYYRPIFALTNWLLVGSAVVFLYASRRAESRTAEQLRAAELERIRRSRRALESRLLAMQARIEPQFLFNTLVQVERLYERDANLASRTLDDLITYLRVAMPSMRESSSTVARELELARAYLEIVRIRLAERLAVSIEIPPGAENIRMPPMMFLPLIDHVLAHAVVPTFADGSLSIRAEFGSNRLRLTINDTRAKVIGDHDGNGLAAIRERLHALFGDEGRLRLEGTNSTSTEAVLEIPLEHRTGS